MKPAMPDPAVRQWWRALPLALCCAVAAASDDGGSIATDRPDFVESSNVVGPGRLQIEAGLAWERRGSRAGAHERGTATPTLLRLGVATDWELRLESDGRVTRRARDGAMAPTITERGYADASLGLKWHAADAGGEGQALRPSVALLLHADLDTGTAAFRGVGVRPSLRAVAEWELPDGYSMGVMPGVALERADSGRRHAVGIFGIVLGKAFTPRWRGFVELAAPSIQRRRHGGTVATLDIGAAFLWTPQVQLDAVVQRGVTRQAADLAAGLGASMRF